MSASKTVAVVGGGAAGMMAAFRAAQAGANVILLEKNEKLGKKIYITGKGRCNLSNSCETQEFFSHVVSNPKFLYSSLYSFDGEQTRAFFEERGCRLKEERGGRIFPVSDHASDVIRTLEKSLREEKVQIRLHTEVKGLIAREEGFCLRIRENGKDGEIRADAVVVACGGISYPSTGSDGSFFKILEGLGHSLTAPKGALVPLVIREEEECRALQGLALKNVALVLQKGKKKIYEGFGEMLYTHFGMSGPLVLSASSLYQKKCSGEEVSLLIDLKPALQAEQLDARLLREFDANKNKHFSNVLPALLPGKMAECFPARCGIAAERAVNSITKEERQRLVSLLKGLPYTVTGTRGAEEAIITQGGIRVKEVDPSTMGSRLVKGLYLAGEMLDVDAFTGGFNLQIAWSTGHLAGLHAAMD